MAQYIFFHRVRARDQSNLIRSIIRQHTDHLLLFPEQLLQLLCVAIEPQAKTGQLSLPPFVYCFFPDFLKSFLLLHSIYDAAFISQIDPTMYDIQVAVYTVISSTFRAVPLHPRKSIKNLHAEFVSFCEKGVLLIYVGSVTAIRRDFGIGVIFRLEIRWIRLV